MDLVPLKTQENDKKAFLSHTMVQNAKTFTKLALTFEIIGFF